MTIEKSDGTHIDPGTVHAVLDLSPELVLEVAPDTGRITYANPGAIRLLGLAREALESEPIFSLIHPDDLVSCQLKLEEVVRQGQSGASDVRLRNGEGEWRHFEIVCRRIAVDAEPRIIAWGRDTTARMDQANALLDSEARFQALAQNAYDLIAETDVQGVVTYASPNHETVLGLSPNERIGKNALDFIHPEDREFLSGDLAGERSHSMASSAFRYLAADGEWRWVETSSTLYETARGEQRIVSVTRDVTDRRAIQDARMEAEQRYRALVAHAPLAIFCVDADGRMIDHNPALEQVLGASSDESQRAHFSEWVHPGDREAITQLFVDQIEGRVTGGVSDFRLLRQDSTIRWARVHSAAVTRPDGDNPIVVGMVEDVTDQRALQEQLLQAQKMEAVGTLAGGIAHDFNNLLTSILGSSEILLDKLDRESPLTKAALRIKKAAERGSGLTAQLLAFSRKQVTQPEIIQLNRAVEEARELFIRMIGEDIEVKLDLDPEAGALAFDPGQLDQVIVNLVVNARDAMQNGGRLRLRTQVTEVNSPESEGLGLSVGTYSTLSIEDTGTGIAPDTLSQVFDPFFTTKEPGKGTGLGLATVRGIMERHKGAITVESVEGQGTAFTLYFPRLEASIEPAADASPDSEPGDGAGKTILIVEDDALMRDLMSEVLEMEGFAIYQAEDPETALRLVREERVMIDLVITDVVMPQMSGFELAGQLAKSAAGLSVLFMSGYTDQVLADRGQLGPDDAFLRKPFGNRQLLGKIRELLSDSHEGSSESVP